jgi:hypothetical protein
MPRRARARRKRLTVAFARLFAGGINEDNAVANRAVVSAVGLGLTRAKLSRNSNQIARGRIRRFESDMPSQAVWSDRRG